MPDSQKTQNRDRDINAVQNTYIHNTENVNSAERTKEGLREQELELAGFVQGYKTCETATACKLLAKASQEINCQFDHTAKQSILANLKTAPN